MSTEGDNKAKVILIKFRHETAKAKFNYRKKILLAKIWIEILIKAEEYEMAGAISVEKELLIYKMLEERRASRTLCNRFRYRWIRIKRKMRK